MKSARLGKNNYGSSAHVFFVLALVSDFLLALTFGVTAVLCFVSPRPSLTIWIVFSILFFVSCLTFSLLAVLQPFEKKKALPMLTLGSFVCLFTEVGVSALTFYLVKTVNLELSFLWIELAAAFFVFFLPLAFAALAKKGGDYDSNAI